MEKQNRQFFLSDWKTHGLIGCFLLGFAFFINQDMKIYGLYMDDLNRWYWYKEQTFWEDILPLGGPRFRSLFNLASRLELNLIGTHIEWIVPFNILLNALIAFLVYRISRKYSHNTFVGSLCGFLYLLSRFSYYQIGQMMGLLETLSLVMAIGILYLLYEYLNEESSRGQGKFFWSCFLYGCICFVHERYMVLFPLLLLVLFFRKESNRKLWAASIGVFLMVQVIRFLTIGTLLPAGTGGTKVVKTFSISTVFQYAFSQIAYVFGINAGPTMFSGEYFSDSPVWVLALVALSDFMLLGLVFAFIRFLFRRPENFWKYVQNAFLFFCFIGACIACSSVTIRVEMRWVYVSYTAALLFMSWMYGVLTVYYSKNQKPSPSRFLLILIAAYGILMVPVETHYRSKFPMLYYWGDQHRYNSLAQETYGLYGDDIYGKTIYVIGDNFHLNDFCAENFFRVFDKENRENCIEILHVEDIRDIGTITNNMLVIQEDLKNNRFHDVTNLAKDFKCRSIYGYYDDNWIDEQARIQVMAGKTGKIDLTFTYPIAMDPNVTYEIMVYKNHQQEQNVKLTENIKEITIESEPYELVTLDFQTSFCIPGSNEKRGKTNLAIFLEIAAD